MSYELKNFVISDILRIFAEYKYLKACDMDNFVNINLNIPRSDVHFLSELVKKMGWGMTQSKVVSPSARNKVKLAQRLYGCIQLPEDFDYKKEVASALSDKYHP